MPPQQDCDNTQRLKEEAWAKLCKESGWGLVSVVSNCRFAVSLIALVDSVTKTRYVFVTPGCEHHTELAGT